MCKTARQKAVCMSLGSPRWQVGLFPILVFIWLIPLSWINRSMLRHLFSNERWGGGGGALNHLTLLFCKSAYIHVYHVSHAKYSHTSLPLPKQLKSSVDSTLEDKASSRDSGMKSQGQLTSNSDHLAERLQSMF